MSRRFIQTAALACVFLVSLSAVAGAQCTVSQPNSNNPWTHSEWLGQQFKACSDGLITSITFTPAFTKDHTFGLEPGKLVAPPFTQTISTTAGVPYTVIVNPSFPVTSGTTYAFGIIDPLGGSVAMHAQTGDPYLDGKMIFMFGTTVGVGANAPDAKFEVTIVAGPTPVEVSTWGRIKSLYEN